jgi:hypothetical protein
MSANDIRWRDVFPDWQVSGLDDSYHKRATLGIWDEHD